MHLRVGLKPSNRGARRRRTTMWTVGLWTAGLWCAITLASAQTPEEAEALLYRSAERYRTAESYLFIANEKTVTAAGLQRRETGSTVLTAKDADGRTRVEIDDGSNGGVAVDDGSSRWLYVPQMEKYVELPRGQALAQGDQSIPGLDFAALVKRYLDRYGSLDQRVLNARIVGTEKVATQQGEVECDRVAAVYNPPPGLREGKIEREYWLARQGGEVLRERSVASMLQPESQNRVTVTQEVDFQRAQIGAGGDERLFVFVPPPGARQVESFREDSSNENQVDRQAPDFTLENISDGTSMQLSSLRGKVVLLDFWATWCGPCRYDMPYVQALYDEHKERGLAVFGVNSEIHTVAINYLAKNGLTFPTLHDERMRVAMLFQVQALPSFVVIDRQGRIAGYLVGTRTKAQLEKALFDAGL
ncbi:MAG: redoxin domain-containing protein [Acidobacteria bacterium]|nr:redoxin domain-containing protein [Acidobacteriota bacterium]